MKKLALSLIGFILLSASGCAHKRIAIAGDPARTATTSARELAQEPKMEMPAAVYKTLAQVVETIPHDGDDDQRRVAMEKAVATLRARFGPRWVWKTEHGTMVQPVGQFQFSGSKDGLGYVPDGDVVHGRLTTMFIWDTINGGSRKLNAAPLVSEPARQAYVLAVEPRDWLAGTAPPPTTPAPAPQPPLPVPPATTAPADPPEWMLSLLATLADAENLLRAELKAIREELAELRARPAPVYVGGVDVFGRRLTLTLEPRK